MDLAFDQDTFASLPSSTFSSVDQTSPNLSYYPASNFATTSTHSFHSGSTCQAAFPTPGMFMGIANRPAHNDSHLPLNYSQPFLAQSPLKPHFQQPCQSCLAPSEILGPSGTSPLPIDSLPPTVDASPSTSVDSVLAHTPLLDIKPLPHSFTPDVIHPIPLLTHASPNHEEQQHEIYGYTGKVKMMEPISDIEPETAPEGRKRARTAQACEKCRTRKARVSAFHVDSVASSLMASMQCFGGNPCNRCVKRRFSCEFSSTIRQRGPIKPHDGEDKPKCRRLSETQPKRKRIVALSSDAEFEDEDEDELSSNQLGLEIVSPSEDLDKDAEGEDDNDAKAWYISSKPQVSPVTEPIYPFSFPTTYGYSNSHTPVMPPLQLGVGASASSMLLNYANAATYIKRETKQHLADVYGDGSVGLRSSLGGYGGLAANLANIHYNNNVTS